MIIKLYPLYWTLGLKAPWKVSNIMDARTQEDMFFYPKIFSKYHKYASFRPVVLWFYFNERYSRAGLSGETCKISLHFSIAILYQLICFDALLCTNNLIYVILVILTLCNISHVILKSIKISPFFVILLEQKSSTFQICCKHIGSSRFVVKSPTVSQYWRP